MPLSPTRLRYLVSLGLATVLAVVASACALNTSTQNATSYCRAFYRGAKGPLQIRHWDTAEPEKEPLRYGLVHLGGLRNVPATFDVMVRSAPDEILPDTRTVQHSLEQTTRPRRALASLLQDLMHRSVDGKEVTGSLARINNYLVLHCPGESPLARETLLFNATGEPQK
jgi:hypothetical protein